MFHNLKAEIKNFFSEIFQVLPKTQNTPTIFLFFEIQWTRICFHDMLYVVKLWGVKWFYDLFESGMNWKIKWRHYPPAGNSIGQNCSCLLEIDPSNFINEKNAVSERWPNNTGTAGVNQKAMFYVSCRSRDISPTRDFQGFSNLIHPMYFPTQTRLNIPWKRSPWYQTLYTCT